MKRILGIAATVFLASPVMAQISVGKEVHVSASRPNVVHDEVLMEADPSNPSRLIACPLGRAPEVVSTSLKGRGGGSPFGGEVYMSDDGGKSWRFATEFVSTNRLGTGDVHCGFGARGEAFLVTVVHDPTPVDSADASAEYTRGQTYQVIRRSTDGGRTWGSDVRMLESDGIDRQYVIADATNSKYRGNVYVTGHTSIRNIYGDGMGTALTLWRSTDGGVTWGRPIKTFAKKPPGIFNPWNPVILDDGTIVFAYWDQSWSDRSPTGGLSRIPMKVVLSSDGGETFGKAYDVADIHAFEPPMTLALDRSNGPFKGRLYVSWPDRRDGRMRMYVTHSDDKGRTWSAPVVVDDTRASLDTSKGPDLAVPTVAVNKDGVVGALWYDRRDVADNKGWWVRFSASYDGGDTWTPSVRVSSRPKGFMEGERTTLESSASLQKSGSDRISQVRIGLREWTGGGHTTGFTADGNGVFQAVWVDDRTGLHQAWGAPIAVTGVAMKNGGGELAAYKDVSAKAQVMLVATNYEENAKRITATIRVRNISKDTLRAPMKLRLLRMTSDIAIARPANAENKLTGPGAIWDLGALLPNGMLLPDQESKDTQLVFTLSDVRSFKDVKGFASNVLSFETKVLSR
jgi:hypothetical protein